MTERTEWEKFFDAHAPIYMDNVWTGGSIEEVDFFVDTFGLSPGIRVLDIGCGTGRHSVELARRGFRVTGVDLSAGMLLEAEKAASAAGVEVEWVKADATRFETPLPFDAALCACEGSFGLLSVGDDPTGQALAILDRIRRALKPGGAFLLTALNGLAMMLRSRKEGGSFDPGSMTESVEMDVDGAGTKGKVAVRERGFTIPELALLLRMSGFEVDHVGGGTAGRWGKRPLEEEEYEIIALAWRGEVR